MKKLLFTAGIATIILSGCDKKTADDILHGLIEERPIRDYVIDDNGLKKDFKLTSLALGNPTEFGMEFQTDKDGTVFELIANVPDVDGDYIVCLWESDSKNLLVKDTIYSIGDFSYANLSLQGKDVKITAGKKYMVGVLIPGKSGGGVHPANILTRTNNEQLLPLKQNSITYTGNFSKETNAPAFPDVLNSNQNTINGIVDIGFKPQ